MENYQDKYLDERFAGIKALIMANHELTEIQLDRILDQTTKTNGKVLDLQNRVGKIEFYQQTCPREDVKTLEPVIFFAKRPKLFGVLMVGGFTIMVVNLLLFILKIWRA